MTAPADRLLAAADLLEELAGEATEGPWRNHDTYLNLGGYTATVLSGKSDDVHLVAHLPSYSHDSSQFQEQPHANARYIATVNPEVGMALAVWLRAVAERANIVADTVGRGWTNPTVETIVAGNITAWTEALALADLLLAGAS